MDRVHDRASIIAEEEEDRISNLPDDIIHYILSFLDMKYAVQTSTLSKKWKHIWTSMPHLNLNSETFPTLPQFAKFVKHALSHRNHLTEVSTLELKFRGVATQFSVKSVVEYAYSHNVRQMSMIWVRFSRKVLEFPRYLFSSHTLKHLTLATDRHNSRMLQCVPKSAWDFPVLETLNLRNLDLDDHGDKSLNLFSKCVNLKDLTLDGCSMFGLDIFTVCAPLLSNLTITHPVYFPKVFNVVAPQLENLTTSVNTCTCYDGFDFLRFSTEGLDSLEKVNLSLSRCSYKKESFVPQLLDLFQKLRSAKFLILDKGILGALSSCVDQLLHEPCPFNNLKCLKQKDSIKSMPTQLINYFRESSPTATFIMDLDLPPQVAHKRSMERKRILEEIKQQEEAMTDLKRIKINIQDGVMAQQKEMLEALQLHFEKLIMSNLHVQVAGGNPNDELIHSMKSIMELIPERLRVSVEAQFFYWYQKMKSMFLTHIDASLWAKIEMELGITQSDVVANGRSGK